MLRRTFLLLAAAAALAGCNARLATPRNAPQQPVIVDDRSNSVQVTILQINDVYEIMPLGGSGLGGLARVATLKKQLLARNPNTFMVLAGDVLSPSAMSSARAGSDGGALNGQHMVDIMNRICLDYATFGNHEFDLRKPDFDKRMAESKFAWFSSNVLGADGKPLPNTPANVVLNLARGGRGGPVMRLGMFGLTIDSNAAAYVKYTDPFETARAQVAELKGKADVIVALTHLAFPQDEQLAETVPGIAMVLGGHEHQNIGAKRGPAFAPVMKADSNAKSAYVHHLRYDVQTKKLTIDSELVLIDESIREDPEVATVVRDWRDRAFAAFKQSGLDPEKSIATLKEMLDGRELATRTGETNLTKMILDAMLQAQPDAEVAIFNSGSIRIDDFLGPGPITQYDVLRVLPYPGQLQVATITGSMLQRIISEGRSDARRNTGGFLQVRQRAGSDFIALNRDYKVVMNDYLLNGNERGLEFIKPGAEIRILPNPAKEWRLAVIEKLMR
jgi:5'-nucleotidase / UDP-sugar diphosphatase